MYSGTASFGATSIQSPGTYDIFVCKLDPKGVFLWSTKLGSSTKATGWGLYPEPQGTLLVSGGLIGSAMAGSHSLVSNGLADAVLLRLDAKGNALGGLVAGGTQGDGAFRLSVDNLGHAYVVGWFAGSATFGAITQNATSTKDGFVWMVPKNSF